MALEEFEKEEKSKKKAKKREEKDKKREKDEEADRRARWTAMIEQGYSLQDKVALEEFEEEEKTKEKAKRNVQPRTTDRSGTQKPSRPSRGRNERPSNWARGDSRESGFSQGPGAIVCIGSWQEPGARQ